MQIPLDNYYGISKILAWLSWVKWVSRRLTVLDILKKIMGNIERLRQWNWQGPPQYNNPTILEFPLYIKTRLLRFIHFSNSALLWRHNGLDRVPHHQPHECLLNRSFRCRSKKTSKFRVTGLCVGNSPETVEFPAQLASNAENFPPDDVIMCDAKSGLLIRVCHVAAIPPTHMFTVTTLSNEGHWCWQAALIASWHRNRLTCSSNSRRRVQWLGVHYTWRASQRLYVCS